MAEKKNNKSKKRSGCGCGKRRQVSNSAPSTSQQTKNVQKRRIANKKKSI